MNKAPNSRVNLDKAIERHFGSGAKFIEARSLLASAIVGQFLPDGVAKGGSALKLRFGADGFRATRASSPRHVLGARASSPRPATTVALSPLQFALSGLSARRPQISETFPEPAAKNESPSCHGSASAPQTNGIIVSGLMTPKEAPG